MSEPENQQQPKRPSPRDAVPGVVDPMGGNVSPGGAARVATPAQVAAAMKALNCWEQGTARGWCRIHGEFSSPVEERGCVYAVGVADAVVAVADSEQAALVEEIRSMGRDALAEAQAYRALFAENERLRAERDEWHDAAYNWAYFNQRRAEAAEAALAEARAQVAGLTEQWGTDDQTDDHEWADEQVDEASARRIAEADPYLIVVHRFVTKWVQP